MSDVLQRDNIEARHPTAGRGRTRPHRGSIAHRVGTLVAVACACLLAPCTALATPCEKNYVGPEGGSWGAAANWEGAGLPTAAQSVCIPAGKGTVVVPSGLTAEARVLRDASALQVEGDGLLTLSEKASGESNASTIAGLSLGAQAQLSTATGWLFLSATNTIDGRLVGSAGVVGLKDGVLDGTGTIAPPFTAYAGTVQPGAPGGVGTLHFEGSYSQHEAASTEIDIASRTQFGEIRPAGDASLAGGQIVVHLLGGFRPAPHEAWTFIAGGLGVAAFGAVTVTPQSFTWHEEPAAAVLEYNSAEGPETRAEGREAPVPSAAPQASPQGAATLVTEPATALSSAAVEALQLGCSGRPLVLNDVYVNAGRVVIEGYAAKRLAGGTVKILFNAGKVVATARVQPSGRYETTAPVPPARVRDALSTRYTAVLGVLKSLHLKLMRRLILEPPRASGATVTLAGVVEPPLTRPAAPIVVEQQLECGRTRIVGRYMPSHDGRFKIAVSVPAGASAAIYRLTSDVAANSHAANEGFATFSLPLPVTIG